MHGQGVVGDEDVPCRLVESGAMAGRTGLGGDVARQILADRVGLGLVVAPLHVVDDALEGLGLGHRAAAVVEMDELDGLAAGAVEHHVARLVGQLVPRGLHVEAVVVSERAQELEIVGGAAVPAADGAAGEAQLGIGRPPWSGRRTAPRPARRKWGRRRPGLLKENSRGSSSSML